MPRKAKITAVPVEQEQQVVSEEPVEPKTDAEQMTDIINEVNTIPKAMHRHWSSKRRSWIR